MKRNKPSGAQYRKAKKIKEQSTKSCRKLLNAFIHRTTNSPQNQINENISNSGETTVDVHALPTVSNTFVPPSAADNSDVNPECDEEKDASVYFGHNLTRSSNQSVSSVPTKQSNVASEEVEENTAFDHNLQLQTKNNKNMVSPDAENPNLNLEPVLEAEKIILDYELPTRNNSNLSLTTDENSIESMEKAADESSPTTVHFRLPTTAITPVLPTSVENLNVTPVAEIMTDIGRWPNVISRQFRDFVVEKGTKHIQNNCNAFPLDESGRSMNSSWFEKKLKNGNVINRTWLCYSPHKNALFCLCCRLFQQKNYSSSFSSVSGFSNWRKLNPRIEDHETSVAHRQSFMEWKELEIRIRGCSTVDSHIEQQISNEAKKWRQILERVVATIQTLAQQNLALRGHREFITASGNHGNFLALLRYLAKFDPIMNSHLESVSANAGSGRSSYLSPDIQNEIISLIGEQVRKTIIASCKKAKYYSIMFDTTPDSSHEEQMSQILRFVDIKERSVEVKECFIDFIPVHDKTAAGITNYITSKLEQDGLDLKDCRGQSYDNQATMAGIHNGVQQRILELNPMAVFVPCNNHSLNLVGVHAAHVNSQSISFFGVMEKLFAFFSSSTHRWTVLKEHVEITVKRHAETRWSSKADAVKAVSTQLDKIIVCLEKLRDVPTETVDTRQDAAVLIGALETFQFVSFLYFWAEILPTLNHAQKVLQIEGINFRSAMLRLQTFQDQLTEFRTMLPEIVIEKSVSKCNEWGVEIGKRTRKKKKMPGEKCDDVPLTPEEELKRCVVEVIDRLSSEMRDRFTQMSELEKRFGFLCNFEDYIQNTISDETLANHCEQLSNCYPQDLDVKELISDTKDVLALLQRARKNGENLNLKPIGILSFINSMGSESYRSLSTALQIFLTIPVSVASCERSFSKLKLIKSYLRSTMTESRLTNLAIISIEHEISSSLDLSKIVENFAAAKARKVKL